MSPECLVSNLPYLYEWIFFAAFPVYAYIIVIFVTLVRRSIIRCMNGDDYEFENGNWLTINFNFFTVMVTFMYVVRSGRARGGGRDAKTGCLGLRNPTNLSLAMRPARTNLAFFSPFVRAPGRSTRICSFSHCAFGLRPE